MSPDQQRGLRDVPESWHPFLAKWRKDCAEVIATGIEPMWRRPDRRQRDARIVQLREAGQTYRQIANEIHIDVGMVRSVVEARCPVLAGHPNRRWRQPA